MLDGCSWLKIETLLKDGAKEFYHKPARLGHQIDFYRQVPIDSFACQQVSGSILRAARDSW